MSTIGERINHTGRPQFGVGIPVSPGSLTVPKPVIFTDFFGGLDSSDAPFDGEPKSAYAAVDVEATDNDRLRLAPGITLTEDTGHSLRHIYAQASLDYGTELICIDGAYLGIKTTSTFSWYNLGLSVAGKSWAFANYAGTLIAGNGEDMTFLRNSGSTTITDISASIKAKVFGVAFGRIFAGYYFGASAFQPLGIAWNAVSADPADWSGLGSGSELLISDQSDADEVIALKPVGFDMLAILCRQSIWIGVATGDTYRPADFRLRVSGVGCVAPDTVVASPDGVTFLSDDGVRSFDGTQCAVISKQINTELLPLDFTKITQYTAAYDSVRKRYILCTPYATWVFDYKDRRWFKRSAVSDSVVAFSDLSLTPAWSDVQGTWDEQAALTWNDFGASILGGYAHIYYTTGTKIGQEDYTVRSNFGTEFTGYWKTQLGTREDLSQLFRIASAQIAFAGYGDITLYVPDVSGAISEYDSVFLPSVSADIAVADIRRIAVARGIETELELNSPDLEIERISFFVTPAGPAPSISLSSSTIRTESGSALLTESGQDLLI